MRPFSRVREIEIEDLRIGRIRYVVRENFIDRLAGVLSPEWKLRRLKARAALQGPPPPPRPRVVSPGLTREDVLGKREGWCHWSGFEDRRFRG